MKRALLLLTAVVLAGCSSSSGTPAPATFNLANVTIAYSGYATSNTYWNILGKAAATEAAAKGVKFVDVTATTNDSGIQLQAVNSELSQKPSALIIGSVDNNVFGTTIATAKAAGIPILAVDTGINDPYISALIQTDNEGAGKLIGQQICTDTGGKGTALVLGGTVGAQSGDARKKGVEETITACGLKDDGQYGNWDSATDVSLSDATIASTPDLSAIFVPHSDGAAAVAKEVSDKGKTATVKVYGFDGSAAIHQDNVTMGKTIVDDAITILQGGTVPQTVLIPPVLITKANAASFQ